MGTIFHIHEMLKYFVISCGRKNQALRLLQDEASLLPSDKRRVLNSQIQSSPHLSLVIFFHCQRISRKEVHRHMEIFMQPLKYDNDGNATSLFHTYFINDINITLHYMYLQYPFSKKIRIVRLVRDRFFFSILLNPIVLYLEFNVCRRQHNSVVL